MNKKGFTLVEVVVSIVLVSVVMISLLASLLKIKETYNIVHDNNEVLIYSSSITRIINNDIAKNQGIRNAGCDRCNKIDEKCDYKCELTLGTGDKRVIKINTHKSLVKQENNIKTEDVISTLTYSDKTSGKILYIKSLDSTQYLDSDNNVVSSSGYYFNNIILSADRQFNNDDKQDVLKKIVITFGGEEINKNESSKYDVVIYSLARYDLSSQVSEPIIDEPGSINNYVFSFSYTGSYDVSEGTYSISESVVNISSTNWKVKFLTSGTLTIYSIASKADIFLVGGGGGGSIALRETGGGGGGGYTKTYPNQELSTTSYNVTIGEGGAAGVFWWDYIDRRYGKSGGTTSLGSYSAAGGEGGKLYTNNPYQGYGGSGGSGGGGGSYTTGCWRPDSYNLNVSYGGTNGSDGTSGYYNNNCTYNAGVYGECSCQSNPHYSSGGSGQGSNTREFGELTGKLYAGGGDGGFYFYSAYEGPNCVYAGKIYRTSDNPNNGIGGRSGEAGGTNTGGGGGGGYYYNNSCFAPEGTPASEIKVSTQYPGAGGSGIAIIRNHR